MDLFDEIKIGGEEAVRNLLGRQEAVDFDCKLKDPSSENLTGSDKEKLTKTLSALSNSMGGVLLWGVDARRNQATGFDEITGFEPIKRVEQFAEELKRIWSERIMPRLDSVDCEIIRCSNDTSTGFIAFRVLRSERRPHRCEVTKCYYRRAGDSTRVMEHFEVEDAFRRLAIPTLSVSMLINERGRSNRDNHFVADANITLTLANDSGVSARFPYLTVEQHFPIPSWSDVHGIKTFEQGDEIHFEGGADVVINPGVSRPMGNVLVSFRFDITGRRALARADTIRQITLPVAFGSYNAPRQRRRVELDFVQLQSAFPDIAFV